MARRMIARKQEGNIVNIASVLGFGVMKFLSPYTISKAGIIQATKAMALELAGNRIRVNALAPGYIDTEMNHDFWSTPAGEKLTKRIPQRRVGAESDLDGAIMLLASQRLALHDRQRRHRGWRVLADVNGLRSSPRHCEQPTPSFRDGPQDQTRNLADSGSMLRILRNDGERLSGDYDKNRSIFSSRAILAP